MPRIPMHLLALALLLGCPGGAGDSPDDDDTGEAGDDDAGDDDAGDDDAGDDDASGSREPQQVFASPDGPPVGGTAFSIAPDGTAYVLWVSGGDDRDLWLSRSVDGSAWESPVQLDPPGHNVGGNLAGIRPLIDATNTRVAVTWVTLPARGVYVTSSPADTLDFAPARFIGTEQQGVFQEFTDVAVSPVDDEVWVVWYWWEAQGDKVMMLARESADWVPRDVSSMAPVVPCDCCPHRLIMLPDGDGLLAWRANDDDVRNLYTVRIPADGSEPIVAQSSFTDWVVGQCPVQGPRVAVRSDGTLLHTWADASSGRYRVYLTASDDGAASWADERVLSGGEEFAQTDPEIAIDGDDRAFIVWQQRWQGPSQVTIAQGEPFAAPVDLVVDGGTLAEPQIATGPRGTFAAGSVGERSIWVLPLDPLR